ncbi:MAG: glycosyltransferase [Ignavibacteria bacterium]|nr:glycosyltransferase [Ignavibacteria bacterium]
MGKKGFTYKDFDSKEYADKKTYWRRRNRYYHNSITEFIKFVVPAGASVLEIGCGAGETLSALGSGYAAGIEINRFLAAEGAKRFPGIEYITADIESEEPLNGLISKNAKFDFIIVSDLVGTLQDIQKTFEKLTAVSHSGTKIIVTYYNYFWNPVLKLGEMLGMKLKEGETNWLYIEEIKNLLYLSDYNVIKSGSLMLIPKRIPLISGLFNRYFSKLPILKRLCLAGWVIGNYRKERNAEKEYSVSVLVPCRNEEGNVDRILKRIPELGKHTEIIYVEGNSSDNTYARIEELIKQNPDKDIKLFKQPGKGKGDAVRTGFEKAQGDIFVILDADMTVAPEDLTKFYDALANGKGEFINGTRNVYQMHEKAMRRLNKLGNIFFSKVFTWLLGQRITDTLCGTKALFKKDYERITANRKYFGDFDPFGDFDLLFGASKLNLKIIEIPIRYGERTYGDTNISRFRDGFMLLRMCFFAMRKIKFVP